MRKVSESAALAAALVVVFLVKLSVLLQLGQHPLLVPVGELDGAYYLHFAERVAHGDVWLLDAASFGGQPPPPFFISPLYIYVLALCLKLGGGSLDLARFAQIVLGTAGVGLLALTARRWYGAAAAWWTVALAAGCGLFTFYEIVILQASLDPFLTALDVYLLTRAVQGSSWIFAGAALGLHALNRPNMLIVLAGLALVLVARIGFASASRRLVYAAAFVLAALLVISPATIRNYRATGEFVLISSHGGLNFLIGNGPQADGTFTRVLDIEPSVRGQWLGAPAALRRVMGHDVSASEASRIFLRRALDWIRAHPLDELWLVAKKARFTLSSSFLTLSHSFPFFERDVSGPLRFLLIGPGLIVPFGLFGLAVLGARPREPTGYWIWGAFVPLAFASVVVFFVAARYRLPYQVALTVPAGALVAWAIERVHARSTWMLAVAFIATAGLARFVTAPLGLDDGRAEERVRMGLHEIGAGRVAEGEAWIRRGLEGHGFPGVVHMRVGQAYESLGRPSEAIDHYREALAVDPRESTVHFTLGRALVGAGRTEEAVAELEAVRTGASADAAARLLAVAFARLGRQDDAARVSRTLDAERWDAGEAREFGAALADAGRPDLATPAFLRAAQAGGRGDDYDRLGLIYVLTKRPAEALAAFEEAVRRDGTSARNRLNYAVALAGAGRKDEARRQADEALKIDPNYAKAREFLAAMR